MYLNWVNRLGTKRLLLYNYIIYRSYTVAICYKNVNDYKIINYFKYANLYIILCRLYKILVRLKKVKLKKRLKKKNN